MKRDISVEILRISAILFVIGTHLKQGFYIDGQLDFMRVFIACLVGDGVAVYWVILGFFYFFILLVKIFRILKELVRQLRGLYYRYLYTVSLFSIFMILSLKIKT